MTPLQQAAQALVDRWDTPLWKEAAPTAECIYRLRDALAAELASAALPAPAVPEGWKLVPIEPTPEMRSVMRSYGLLMQHSFWIEVLSATPQPQEPQHG